MCFDIYDMLLVKMLLNRICDLLVLTQDKLHCIFFFNKIIDEIS